MEPEIRTRQQFWGNFEPKKAEAANTNVMPLTGQTVKRFDKGNKTMIRKTGSVDGAPDGVQTNPTPGEQPQRNPQTLISPRVDVSGKEPEKGVVKKEASYYALPSHKKYPIDSYGDVVKAADYFSKNASLFAPIHRREYCKNLQKRASALGILTDETIKKYASATYAPADELAVAIDGRKALLNDDHCSVLDKLAQTQPQVHPELFAETLHEFDKVAGIDHLYGVEILDPYYSTFGLVKKAGGTHVMGNDIVTDGQLVEFARIDSHRLCKTYGEDFVKEFKKDPAGIFSSLPVDQKKIISRMANEANQLKTAY
jgi:hypothetical protein